MTQMNIYKKVCQFYLTHLSYMTKWSFPSKCDEIITFSIISPLQPLPNGFQSYYP